MAMFTPNNQLHGGGRKSSGNPSAGGTNPQLAEGIRWHEAAVAGNKEAVGKAVEIFGKIRSSSSPNPLVDAYYGSATCLLGRDAVDPMVRMNKAMEGLKLLDATVSQNPQNLQVRSLRGHVCNNLPEMYFHRTPTAIEDFRYLVSRYEQDNNLLAPSYYQQVLFELGSAYKKVNQTEDAMKCWKKLGGITTDPKYVHLLRQEGITVTGGPSAADTAEWKQKKKN